jgi:hypothetical protein
MVLKWGYGGVISVSNSTASDNGTDGIAGGDGPPVGGGSVTNNVLQNNSGRGIVLLCPVSAFGNKSMNNAGGNLVTSDNTCLLSGNKTTP